MVEESLNRRLCSMKLTVRQTQVLKLIAEGMTTKEIADTLVVSVHTVNRHRANIRNKLGVRNSVELVKYAVDHGLLASALIVS